MDATDVRALREWSPLTDVFAKIPLKVQKGFFFVDLNVTCIDALDEYLALGTDAGIVYWYNRQNGSVQKLRTEVNRKCWILFFCLFVHDFTTTIRMIHSENANCLMISNFD